MPALKFDNVAGSWQGNDYPSVAMTSVSVGSGSPAALVFMTHMNVDFDGAPNAYGPAGTNPLDNLGNAGQATGYYGLVHVDPDADVPGDPKKRKFREYLKVDERYPDANGDCPVVQQTGHFAGYFVSGTSHKNPSGSKSQYEQSHYLDSSAVAFCALSYSLSQKGVSGGDYGIAFRHDSYRKASYTFLEGEGHGKGTAKAGAVGECSYKVFLDIGGIPKTPAQNQPNNTFPTTFVVFPGSKASQLLTISMADDSEDFAVFVALQAEADAKAKGSSGLAAFLKYVADGRKKKPAHYDSVVGVLRASGYTPGLGEFVGAGKDWGAEIRKGIADALP